MLIVTGDMNAKVGDDNRNYEWVMGRHGLGTRNYKGERLCEMCDINTGTMFPHKNIHKATWVSPDRVTRNQIDHILINKRFRNSVKNTRRRQPKEKKSIRVKCDTAKLKNEDIRRKFTIALRNRYQELEDEGPEVAEDEEVEHDCHVMEKTYTEVADLEAVLSRPSKKKPWISEESWDLVDQS